MHKSKRFLSLVLSLLLGVSGLSVMWIGGVQSSAASPAPSGYVAVGEVNTSLSKASALFNDGTVLTVTYIGTAPAPGAVYSYTLDNQGQYTFTSLELNWSESNQLSDTLKSNGDTGSNNPGEWPITLWSWGGFSDSSWSNTVFHFSDQAPIFVRYSTTSWRVFTYASGLFKTDIEGTTVSGYFNKPTYDGANHWCDLLVIGAYDNTNGAIPPTCTAGPSLNLSDYTAYNTGDKNVVLSTTPDPDPVVEEEYYTGAIDGYCAVGEVDNTAKKASLLFGNGKVQVVTYSGKEPKSGAVYGYKADGDIYKFALPVLNWENSNQLSNTIKADGKTAATNGGAWDINTYYYGNFQDLNPSSSNIYFPSPDMPVFIRYSETSWRVFTGIPQGLLTSSEQAPNGTTRGYFVPRYDQTLYDSYTPVLGAGVYYSDVLIIADYGANGIKPANKATTATFDPKHIGWDEGNINVMLSVVNVKAVSTGICAVGEVSADGGKAVILLPDGKTLTVNVSGNAPAEGVIYNYTAYDDGKYSFSEFAFINGPTTINDSWPLRTDAEKQVIQTWNGNTLGLDNHKITADTVVFMRYDKYSWRVITNSKLSKSDFPCNAYFAEKSNPAGGDPIVTVMMIGGYDTAKKEIKTADKASTSFFSANGTGWANANRSVRFNPTAMPNASTGDNTTSMHVIFICLSAAAIFGAIVHRGRRRTSSCGMDKKK